MTAGSKAMAPLAGVVVLDGVTTRNLGPSAGRLVVDTRALKRVGTSAGTVPIVTPNPPSTTVSAFTVMSNLFGVTDNLWPMAGRTLPSNMKEKQDERVNVFVSSHRSAARATGLRR